jgi:hypothetical protein
MDLLHLGNSIWVVTSLFLSIYDYAGAYEAINPVLHEVLQVTNRHRLAITH